MQFEGCSTENGAGDTQYVRKGLMRDLELEQVCPIRRRQQPAAEALQNAVEAVADDCLGQFCRPPARVTKQGVSQDFISFHRSAKCLLIETERGTRETDGGLVRCGGDRERFCQANAALACDGAQFDHSSVCGQTNDRDKPARREVDVAYRYVDSKKVLALLQRNRNELIEERSSQFAPKAGE